VVELHAVRTAAFIHVTLDGVGRDEVGAEMGLFMGQIATMLL